MSLMEEEERQAPSNRGRHYSAALLEAGTLVVVFASIDGLFYKPKPEIHWSNSASGCLLASCCFF